MSPCLTAASSHPKLDSTCLHGRAPSNLRPCSSSATIWRPRNHHYRLITGEHAPAYVKLGDAIREPQDADVLASWVLEHLAPNTGIVLDSGTLTPIAQALRLRASQAGITLGSVGTLDDYPQTGVDLD